MSKTGPNRVLVGALIVGIAWAFPSVSQADLIVHTGWDLFLTQEGTHLQGVPFTGVPLDTFDFGGGIGVKNVDGTDTIVERLDQAEVSNPGKTDTIGIEIVALQFVSVVPYDFGAGADYHYITLQSDRGGPASTGTADITFNNTDEGTFTSKFDVLFDLRIGALNGPIIYSGSKTFTTLNKPPWSHQPPPGTLLIEGVNYLLKGDGTTDQDFFPCGVVTHDAGDSKHLVSTTPEASTFLLFGVGLVGLWAWKCKRGSR